MIDEHSSKEDLYGELVRLRQRNQELESDLSRYRHVAEQYTLVDNTNAWRDQPFNTLLNLLPIGVSICTDLSCQEIRHNPIAAKFLRINDWEIASHSSENMPPFEVLHDGKVLLPEEMPIQQSIWMGEYVRNQEIEFVWEDGVRKTALWNACPLFDIYGSIIGAIAVSEDITKRKQLEKELNQYKTELERKVEERTKELVEANLRVGLSEQKMANLLESISDAFYALDREWRFTYVNAEMLRQFEIQDASEVIGQVLWDAFPNYTDYTYEMFHKAVVEQTAVSYESHSQITGRWHYVHAYPSPDGLSVYFLDMTDLKETQQKLQKSQQDISDILRSISDPFWVVDNQWRIAYINEASADYLGKPQTELLGRNYHDVLPGLADSVQYEKYRQVMFEKVAMHFEAMGVKIKSWYDINVYPCQNGIAIYARDMSEKKQLEQNIVDALEFNQAIVESSPFGINVFDSSGQHVFINDAGAKIAGGTKDQVLRLNLNINQIDVWKPTGLQDVANQVLATGIFATREAHIETVFGEDLWVDYRFNRFFSSGEPHLLLISADITERKVTEKKLRLNQQRMEALEKLNQMTNATTNEITRYAYQEAMKLTCSTIGWLGFINADETEISILSWSDNVVAACWLDDKNLSFPVAGSGLWAEAIRQRRSILINDYSAPHSHKKGLPDGHTPLFRLLVVPIFDGDHIVALISMANKKEDYDDTDIQQLSLLIGAIWRIIQHREAVEALRQAEQEKADILQSITDSFYSLDHEFRFTYLNSAAEKSMGKPREEILGCVVNEVFPAFRPEYLEIYRQVMEENEPKHFENFSEPIQRWIDTSVYPSQNGVAVYFRDIHERQQAEEALRQSEDKFFKAFQSCPMMMAIVNKEDNCYIDVNNAWLEAFGFTREEVVGHRSSDLNLFCNQEDLHEKGLLLEKQGSLNNYEVSFQTINGEIRNGLASSETIYMDGMTCLLYTMIDITEKKQLEREIVRLDRLNLVGEMAASIGHEIRNPLTTIRGFLQMLNGMECYERDRLYFTLMIEELDRANEIISEYLGMAKDRKVDLQAKCLDRVVESLYPMLQADAYYREMNIEMALGKPPETIIDENEIRQLILNMARNGMEAMPPGGMLTIGTTVDGNKVVLFIKDQGHGMDPGLIEKLGTPFLTTKEKGTGLGMAVCYSIASRNNARIEVETSPAGTTFMVYFPAVVEQLKLF